MLQRLHGQTGGGFAHGHNLDLHADVAQGALDVAHPARAADEAGGLGIEQQLGDPLGSDVRRQDHHVGPGVPQLAFGRGRLAAGDDLQARIEVAGAEGDEDIRRIVGKDGGQCPRPLDPGRDKRGLVRGVGRQGEIAVCGRLLDPLRIALEHEEFGLP